LKEKHRDRLVVSGESEVPEISTELFGTAGNEEPPRRQSVRRATATACDCACLATKPKVLLLDEPTEGIQPSIIKEMARTLKRIRDERGLSIVVSEQVFELRARHRPSACLSSRTARSVRDVCARGRRCRADLNIYPSEP